MSIRERANQDLSKARAERERTRSINEAVINPSAELDISAQDLTSHDLNALHAAAPNLAPQAGF